MENRVIKRNSGHSWLPPFQQRGGGCSSHVRWGFSVCPYPRSLICKFESAKASERCGSNAVNIAGLSLASEREIVDCANLLRTSKDARLGGIPAFTMCSPSL